MMAWDKLGCVFCPIGQHAWMRTHAANPVAESLDHERVRVYFSCRDEQNRSHIGSLTMSLEGRKFDVLNVSERPLLSPGEVGTFDDSGVSVGCLSEVSGRKVLYYLGWNLGVTVPWRNSIGLAWFEKDDVLVRNSQAPLLDRNDVDPFSLSYPWVLEEEGVYHMWYGSNLRWGNEQRDMDHLLKYCRSQDGIHWDREGHIAIPFKDETEYAMSKPCVRRLCNVYYMWYSYRGDRYRIGYAESSDCRSWTRLDDQAGIDRSTSGWDSQAVSYPCVFEHGNHQYMLYNGNRYGLTGFGLAISSELVSSTKES